MSQLTDTQIDFIEEQINQSQIQSNELKEDLVDHFCCMIEDDIKRGLSFDAAYEKAYQSVCPNGFDEIHKESLLLLTSKNIITMKKTLYISGFIASVLVTTTFLFKALHWPGAGIVILVGFFALVFVFLPILLWYLYRREISRYGSHKLKYVLGFLGLAISLTGLAFKLFHWPGAGVLIVVGVFILNFGFLPFYFYRMYKSTSQEVDPEKMTRLWIYITGFAGAVLFLTAGLFKLQHWPASGVLLVLSILIINFGFLPLLFKRLYRKSIA